MTGESLLCTVNRMSRLMPFCPFLGFALRTEGLFCLEEEEDAEEESG